MTREQLKNGIIVCHMKYNSNYRIVSSHMRMKDSQKGWTDAVVYAPLYENEYECFCRELGSFLEEFEAVEEDLLKDAERKSLIEKVIWLIEDSYPDTDMWGHDELVKNVTRDLGSRSDELKKMFDNS